MTATFAAFTIFTMACAVAPSWESFLFFRFATGVNASAPIAVIGGVYADIYGNPVSRGRALAVFTGVSQCIRSLFCV
jgi:predicted MFS family arabinose efflux permease